MASSGRGPLRETFDTAAERYDRIRPLYQPEVFDDLALLAALEPESRVLEIGCGSGQATVPMAERGYRVVAVELGARFAEIARRKLATHKNATVIVAPFEDWPLPQEPFDVVVSATAFHWIDPTVRVRKAAEALRSGGNLAVIETSRRPIAPQRVIDRFRDCHKQWTSDPAPAFRPHRPGEPPECLAELEASGLFDRTEVRRYASTHEYSTEEHHELLLTFSNVLALDAERQAGLVRCIDDVIDGDLGARLRESTITHLVVARKE